MTTDHEFIQNDLTACALCGESHHGEPAPVQEFIDEVNVFAASYRQWRSKYGDDIDPDDYPKFDEGTTDFALDALDILLTFTGDR